MENIENKENQTSGFKDSTASETPITPAPSTLKKSSTASTASTPQVSQVSKDSTPSMTDITNEYLDEKHKKRIGSKIDVSQIKNILANFIVPIISLIIAALLFFTIILPSIKELPVLKSTLIEKKSLATSLSEKKKKLNTLLDFKSSVEENNQLVSRVLTSDALVPQVLTQVDLIARESGLVVAKLNYSFDEASDVEGLEYSSVRITLGTEGNYSQVVTFFENLENAGRVINVSDVRFSVSDENIVNANFVLTAPYIELNTKAVTDDPIAFDITDEKFLNLMDSLKKLRIYDISIENTIDIEGLEGTGVSDVTTTPDKDSEEASKVTTPDVPEPSPEFP